MFNLEIYTNKSEDVKLDKELTTITTLSGTLKENCSILNPVIIVSEFNNAMAAVANYAIIPDFARRYFITDIISIKNNLWELHMKVDVLSTYAGSIRNNTASVSRQENKYNLYLKDPYFTAQANKMVQVKLVGIELNDYSYIFLKAGD